MERYHMEQRGRPVRRFFAGAGRVALTVAFFGAAGGRDRGLRDPFGPRVRDHGAGTRTADDGRDGASGHRGRGCRDPALHRPVRSRAGGAALGFEEGGTIADIMVREGDTVTRGAVIARLDTRLLRGRACPPDASRTALMAQVELARRTNATGSRRLLAEGHVTQQRVDETSLRLAELEAALAEAMPGWPPSTCGCPRPKSSRPSTVGSGAAARCGGRGRTWGPW
jgi:hypothetical protein